MLIVKYIGRILCVLAVLLLLFFLLTPFGWAVLGIVFEEQLAKNSLNNPYVDQNFEDWQPVDIEGYSEFYIPGNWKLEPYQGQYMIQYDDGSVIGYIAQIADVDSSLRSWQDAFDLLLGNEWIEEGREYLPGMTTGSNLFAKVTFQEPEEKTIYCLDLEDYSYKESSSILIILPSDNGIDYDSMVEILAAISFSFEYAN